MPDNKHRTHVEMQRTYFDERVHVFRQPIPEDVQRRTRRIVEAAKLGVHSRVLDVGTGMGVLIEHFLAVGVGAENIVGCDLSEKMLVEGQRKYPAVKFWQGDFLEFPEFYGRFDAAFFNACFGNFDDQEKVIERALALLLPGGRMVISHPLGARFVAALHAGEPEIVPHLLPDKQTLLDWVAGFEVELETFVNDPDLYIAAVRHHPAPQSSSRRNHG